VKDGEGVTVGFFVLVSVIMGEIDSVERGPPMVPSVGVTVTAAIVVITLPERTT
jgi:hypothetical protein